MCQRPIDSVSFAVDFSTIFVAYANFISFSCNIKQKNISLPIAFQCQRRVAPEKQ